MEAELQERPQTIVYGLAMNTDDKKQRKDIPALSAAFYAKAEKASGEVLPFYVISSGYDQKTGSFSLFIGGEQAGARLTQKELPGGTYAIVEIRPMLGFLWGLAIGKAKQWFYTQWMPEHGYRARNLEYELHDARSIGKKPVIQLLFAIEPATSEGTGAK